MRTCTWHKRLMKRINNSSEVVFVLVSQTQTSHCKKIVKTGDVRRLGLSLIKQTQIQLKYLGTIDAASPDNPSSCSCIKLANKSTSKKNNVRSHRKNKKLFLEIVLPTQSSSPNNICISTFILFYFKKRTKC